jgi:phenylpyruvate tautomerase PptA (4-oxalocrotonate tautomerase family)
MPLIHVYYPTGALSLPARDALADELTNVALDCEKLPTSPFVKSTTWIYFHELPSEHVYHGGKPRGHKSHFARSECV